ncbi:MAG: hypothetical protein EPO21_00420 [Chloroflexota bacterium]|nr:MAG: hypothetical protein EPO21_00420 [Chloroflexota bacterium]
MTARSIIVSDIEQVLESLRGTLDWPSERGVTFGSGVGYRRALIKDFAVPTSAALELLQPTSDHGRIGQYFAAYGPGPYSVRIGVRGLDAKLEDLWARGTRWSWVDPIDGRARVEVNPADVGGVLIEFEELE